jgi:hypothetical protein
MGKQGGGNLPLVWTVAGRNSLPRPGSIELHPLLVIRLLKCLIAQVDSHPLDWTSGSNSLGGPLAKGGLRVAPHLDLQHIRDAEVWFGPVLWVISPNREPEPDGGEGLGRTVNQNQQNWVHQVQFWFEPGLNLRTYVVNTGTTPAIRLQGRHGGRGGGMSVSTWSTLRASTHSGGGRVLGCCLPPPSHPCGRHP